MKRVQTYKAPGITVTFDPNLCIHSAVCLRTLPLVFDVRRRRWVAPEAASPEQVAAAIRKCPSGALQFAFEGEAAAEPGTAEKAPAGAEILASRNGPLLVEGDFRVLDENGDEIPSAGRAALCRCGGTSNPPFCDGTHLHNGFRTRRPGDNVRPS
jgi:uncharacterized Fe-S cluster protein YjdI/CDGSH-type Zn-finger protein